MSKLLATYGLTPETFAAKLARQGGGCAICTTKVPGGAGAFHCDHDHRFDRAAGLRGLLCASCNSRVAGYEARTVRSSGEDDPNVAAYIAAWRLRHMPRADARWLRGQLMRRSA